MITWRWSEFCVDAIATLKTKLQPGSTKWGYRLELGKMNCGYLDKMLCDNTCCLKEVVDTTIVLNRKITHAKLYKYQFCIENGFPKLDTNEEWWNNYHLPEEEYWHRFYEPCSETSLQRSNFTHLTIISNDYDNRVYCHYALENWNMVYEVNKAAENDWEEIINEEGNIVQQSLLMLGRIHMDA